MIRALLFTILMGLISAAADTVRLKDGSLLEGEILSETSTNLTMEVELAHGTITRPQTIARDLIDTITRPTAAERAQKEMSRAFEAADRYRLDPARSFEAAHYDNVLEKVFRRFLSNYPDSPHVADIQEKISAWEAERKKVAEGQTRLRDRWLPAADAAVLLREETGRAVLDSAESLLKRGKFEEAFSTLEKTKVAASLEAEARDLHARIMDRMLKSLEGELQSTDREVEVTEQRLTRAQQSRDAAQRNLDTYLRTHQRGQLGYDGLTAQYEGTVQRAEEELKRCEGHLGRIRDQQADITRQITQVHSRSASIGIHPSNPLPAKTETTPHVKAPKSEESPELLSSIWTWLGENWYIPVGVVLVGLWLLGRAYS